jgi:hypothetical protein
MRFELGFNGNSPRIWALMGLKIPNKIKYIFEIFNLNLTYRGRKIR